VKSSASGQGDNTNCVEVVLGADLVVMRDSKDRPGPRLNFPAAGWTAFLVNVRADAAIC
jgi:hypothetical protein